MNDFRKTVRIGSGNAGSIFCKIEFAKGRLSISGVEGPKPNGDARGACGQIVMHEWNLSEYAPGWSAETVQRFREVWDRWHLNDMRAGCEHQRHWPTDRKVEVVTYKLTGAALVERNKIESEVKARLLKGESVTLPDGTRAFLDLPYTTMAAPDSEGVGSGRYEVQKRETKALGWLRPSEHPEGMLGKPCDVCGYAYGSKWLHEDVPEDVLEWLAALPDTDVKPAWV